MRAQLFLPIYILICLMSVMSSAQAKEVTLTRNGLTLTGDLTLATGKKPSDGVILLTHGSLAHRDMETIKTFRSLLNERGYNTLAINLSLGLSKRYGMYDCTKPHRHSNEEAVQEIRQWVAWLKNQGARKVTLFGHSRGGAQTAMFAATHKDPAVDRKSVV